LLSKIGSGEIYMTTAVSIAASFAREGHALSEPLQQLASFAQHERSERSIHRWLREFTEAAGLEMQVLKLLLMPPGKLVPEEVNYMHADGNLGANHPSHER
jgi:hypothetical protein